MAYFEFWKRWNDFSGKTSPSEFWAALFIHLLYSIILLIAVCILLVAALDLTADDAIVFVNIFFNVYGMICFVPFLAMTVRRLRDAGYNRKNLWKLLIPWSGIIALFTRCSDDNNDVSQNI